MSPKQERVNKIFFQEYGKPKYGNNAIQMPNIKSILALYILVLYSINM